MLSHYLKDTVHVILCVKVTYSPGKVTHNSTYLRLLVFLLPILFSACASSSPAFLMMYTAYKLNKLGDNILLFLFGTSLLFHVQF